MRLQLDVTTRYQFAAEIRKLCCFRSSLIASGNRASGPKFPHRGFGACRAAGRILRVELCHAGTLQQQVSRRGL